MLEKLMDNDIHIGDPVQFDWEPGCAEDKLLASMLKDADIPHYFSFQVRHDHEAEFRLGVDRKNETKTLELLKKFQDRLGNATFFDIYGGENESFDYEPEETVVEIPDFSPPPKKN